MQNTNKEYTIARFGAMLVAFLMLAAIFMVYLFPWSIPIFWDMPKDTTLPYYGLLMCIEMAPASWAMKNKVLGNTTATNKES